MDEDLAAKFRSLTQEASAAEQRQSAAVDTAKQRRQRFENDVRDRIDREIAPALQEIGSALSEGGWSVGVERPQQTTVVVALHKGKIRAHGGPPRVEFRAHPDGEALVVETYSMGHGGSDGQLTFAEFTPRKAQEKVLQLLKRLSDEIASGNFRATI